MVNNNLFRVFCMVPQRRAQVQAEDRREIVADGKVCREKIAKVLRPKEPVVFARHRTAVSVELVQRVRQTQIAMRQSLSDYR